MNRVTCRHDYVEGEPGDYRCCDCGKEAKSLVALMGGVNVNRPVQVEERDRRLERRATKTPTEHEEQTALFRWAEANEKRYPALRWLHAIPNGGHRHPAVAARLKAEGVKPGVPDVRLDWRSGKYPGLIIEMKRGDRSNHTTTEQNAWLEHYHRQGWAVYVCYGYQDAKDVIEDYLVQAVA